MMVLKAVVLLFALVAGSSAQVVGLGSCPDVTVVADFNATKFLGTWYEQKKFFFIFQAGGSCTTAEYGATDEDNVVSVNNTMINFLGSTSSTTGTATLADSDTAEAKMTVKFVGNPLSAPYWVLGTDYENYAVIWSCNDATIINLQSAWVLTRNRTVDSTVLETATAVLTDNGLDSSKLETTDQTDC